MNRDRITTFRGGAATAKAGTAGYVEFTASLNHDINTTLNRHARSSHTYSGKGGWHPSGETEERAMNRIGGIRRCILDTFPVLRRKEQTAFGEYQSKRKAFEEFERFQP